jgi:hypothetical protein
MTPAAESGLALRLAGPAVAGSTRLLHGTPAQALDALARVLEREVCMTPVRRLADRGVWEPRRDLIGGVLRSLRGDTGLRMLRSTAGISAAAMAVDEGRTLVRVEADLAARRRQRLTAGTVATVTGALAGASAAGIGSLVVADAFTAILAPVAALPLAAGGAAAWLLARGHRQDVARVTEGLERLLDRVEAGAPPAAAPPGLLEMLDGVRRALG